VDVILSCFKLSNVFLSKNRSENLASKKQFRTEFISYRHIVHSFESRIPQTEIVKSTICLHPILFSKYTVQILHILRIGKLKTSKQCGVSTRICHLNGFKVRFSQRKTKKQSDGQDDNTQNRKKMLSVAHSQID